MSAERSTLIADTGRVVDHAGKNKGWFVVVCPDARMVDMAHRALAGVVPPGSSGTGRTFILPNRSRISVASAADQVFVPDDEVYSVMFLGWASAGKESFAGMNRWRLRASNILSDGPKANQAA